ncbi:MAG: ADP-ribosylglycohydrolase family protein [bacterium]|nr:ADP-ribosylglycohydrolase family protein [bacterium]
MDLRERAAGLMVGIGVGNLLGIPWEGKSAAFIAGPNPHGVREITAEAGFPDDDDLAQAILLAEACIEGGDLDLSDLARRFWEWGELNGAGMGGHTKRVLRRYGGADPRRELRNYAQFGRPPTGEVREPRGVGTADASRLAWEESGRNSAGNGSVMRCGPVALRWMRDDAALARNSVTSAVVTHWDWRCVWSTLLADFAIAACLRGERPESGALLDRAGAAVRASGERLSAFGLPETPPASVRSAVESALAPDARIEDLELDGGGTGFAPKTLGAVLWSSRHPGSFEAGLLAIVNAGGDTDSNAAPAGAALGARFGLGGIPRRWRDRAAEIRSWEAPIDAWTQRRPLEWYADRLLRLVE